MKTIPIRNNRKKFRSISISGRLSAAGKVKDRLLVSLSDSF